MVAEREHPGLEVAAATVLPDKLLGVRHGFLRFLRHRVSPAVPLAVVPRDHSDELEVLPMTAEHTVQRALHRARALKEELGETYSFYVACEEGLEVVEIDGNPQHFVRSWSVVLSSVGEAVGGSSAIQLPERLLNGSEGVDGILAVPGTRREGGMLSSLTAGVETRREAAADSTFNALSSLFYGMLESRPDGPFR